MPFPCNWLPLFLAAAALLTASSLERVEPTTEIVIDGLDNPCAVAIDHRNRVFVAESGAARVITVSSGAAVTVVSNFETESYGAAPSYKIGPLGLIVTEDDFLVVGEGGRGAGSDRLMSFKIADLAKAKDADQFQSMTQLPPTDAQPAEGNFYGLAAVGRHVLSTCHGDDTKGWIAKASVKNGQLSAFTRFVATKDLVKTDGPTAIATDSTGSVWVSLFGETNVRHDGVVLKLSETGKLLGKYYTGLNDITGIAICPQTQRLFVLDFSWMDESAGGLFELSGFDTATNSCLARKVLELRRPTAMAFDQEGSLWVTKLDDSSQGKANGKLIKISDL